MTPVKAWKTLSKVRIQDPLVRRWLESRGYKIPRFFFKLSAIRNKMVARLIVMNIYGRRNYLWWSLAVFGTFVSLNTLTKELNENRVDITFVILLLCIAAFCLVALVFSWLYRQKIIPEIFGTEQQIKAICKAQADADLLRRILGLQINSKEPQFEPRIREFEQDPRQYVLTDLDAQKVRTLIEQFGFRKKPAPIFLKPEKPGSQKDPESEPPKWTEQGEDWKNADD